MMRRTKPLQASVRTRSSMSCRGGEFWIKSADPSRRARITPLIWGARARVVPGDAEKAPLRSGRIVTIEARVGAVSRHRGRCDLDCRLRARAVPPERRYSDSRRALRHRGSPRASGDRLKTGDGPFDPHVPSFCSAHGPTATIRFRSPGTTRDDPAVGRSARARFLSAADCRRRQCRF